MTVDRPVIGLDISLASTGLASSKGWTDRVTSKPYGRGITDRALRLHITANKIAECVDRDAVLVVIEAQFSRSGKGQHDMYGLWWLVVARLAVKRLPVATVVDSTLKKYATGDGRADKPAMVAAARAAFPWFDGRDDEADALWLACMGAQYLGQDIAGVPNPPRDPSLLAAATWPDPLGARP